MGQSAVEGRHQHCLFDFAKLTPLLMRLFWSRLSWHVTMFGHPAIVAPRLSVGREGLYPDPLCGRA